MKTLSNKKFLFGAAVALSSLGLAHAQNPSVIVTIENMSPYNGTFLTPVWVGFHNGEFDSYDGGKPASRVSELK